MTNSWRSSFPTTPEVTAEATRVPTAFGPPEPSAVVAPTAPAPSVSLRVGALEDDSVVRMAEDAAVKQNTFTSRPGYPSGMALWETHLHVEAWVRNTTYAKYVWVDVHVLAYDGALVRSETLPLRYARPAGDGGDVFVLDSVLYEGSVATPGSVTPRPDVRVVQYRLYCELEGRVYTDGLLHRCELRPDAASG
jgi:hypothetical protein